MQTKTQGFTLIELLVVVLIIGILTAVAAPQYQKAVEKSKAAQALVALKSIVQAQEAYHMANGTYAASFNELDVELPWTGTETWASSSVVSDTRSNAEWSLQLWTGGVPDHDAGVYLGRLTGKYKGAGFAFLFKNKLGFPNNQMLCAERTSDGIVFESTAGSYCQSLFKGVLENDSSGTRFYVLP